MLYIRADGNTEIGMGHVMRCLSVAEAAADRDSLHPPVFITADAGCRAMIEDRGFRVIVLNTDFRDMMSELPRLEDILRREQNIAGTVLLVDSYQAHSAYYSALKKMEAGKYVRVACFEDMGKTYPADLLINYNIYAPDLEQNYRGPGVENPKRVLLGARYMPLRKAFQKPAEYVVKDKVTDVIITTGGSDPHFATAAFVEALRGDETIAGQGIHLHLVSGPFNRFADELKRRYQNCGEREQHDNGISITIHENVKDMRSLLLESDVVISATGSTIYEVSSLGVPMIVFYFAENQRQGAEALEKRTDIVNAGCFAGNGAAVADRIRTTLKRCIGDKEYRERLHRQEKGLIDGKGAHRIAEQLLELAAAPRGCADGNPSAIHLQQNMSRARTGMTEMRYDHGGREKETIEL